jgi:hypothetical protein
MIKKTKYLDVHDTIDMAIYKEITNRCDVCGELTLSMWSYCRPCYFEVAGYNEKYTKEDAEIEVKRSYKEANEWTPGL